jgi:DNA-binding transcriptional LysR family regulator
MHWCMPARASRKAPVLPNWDDLRLFLEVARRGSFSAAGRHLQVEQSTISRRMAALEQLLAGALFERRPGGSSLTQLGEALRRHAEAMEAELQASVDEASGFEREIEGRVTLALTESVAVHAVIPRVLPALCRAHPKLVVELITSYEVTELGHRQAELALRFFRPRSGDLVAQRIAVMPTALIAHRRFRRTPLAELPLVDVELARQPSLEARYLRRHLRQAPRIITSSYVSQIEAVRAGLGAALLAKSARELDQSLVELGTRELPASPALELWLVAPRALRNVPRVATLWSALEQGLAFLGE